MKRHCNSNYSAFLYMHFSGCICLNYHLTAPAVKPVYTRLSSYAFSLQCSRYGFTPEKNTRISRFKIKEKHLSALHFSFYDAHGSFAYGSFLIHPGFLYTKNTAFGNRKPYFYFTWISLLCDPRRSR